MVVAERGCDLGGMLHARGRAMKECIALAPRVMHQEAIFVASANEPPGLLVDPIERHACIADDETGTRAPKRFEPSLTAHHERRSDGRGAVERNVSTGCDVCQVIDDAFEVVAYFHIIVEEDERATGERRARQDASEPDGRML